MKYLNYLSLILFFSLNANAQQNELNQQLMLCAGESDKEVRGKCFDALNPQSTPHYTTEELLKRDSELKKSIKRLAAPTLSSADLCVSFGEFTREGAPVGELLHELNLRKLPLSARKINQQVVVIGDSVCQMYASLGMPGSINRTVSASGEHVQNIYGRKLYVYTHNGRITSWQDQ